MVVPTEGLRSTIHGSRRIAACWRSSKSFPALFDAMQQAVDDAGEKIPMVAHRRNRGEWLAVMRLSDVLEFLR